MLNIKEQAEFYRIGLLIKLFEVSEAVAWCDSVIMAQPTPEIAIIEAAISGSQGAEIVAGHLGKVEGEANHSPIIARLLRLLLDLLERDSTQSSYVAKAVRRLEQDGYLPAEEYWDFEFLMEEAKIGIFRMEGVIESMRDLIEKYAAPVDDTINTSSTV